MILSVVLVPVENSLQQSLVNQQQNPNRALREADQLRLTVTRTYQPGSEDDEDYSMCESNKCYKKKRTR